MIPMIFCQLCKLERQKMTFQELIQQIRTLSSEELMQVADLVQSLQDETPEAPVQKRILGLGKSMGTAWISPNFDDPLLPDDWMDDPSDPLNWKNNLKDAGE
jgi:hypothetical protein